MAVCVAVIDKDNAPIFIKSNSPVTDDNFSETELKLHYTIHTSLDIVEEKLKVAENAGRGNDMRQLYLGLLLSTEEYKLYGCVTNTKIKFILMVDILCTSLKDNEIRSIFKKINNSYCDAVSNPFYIPGAPLNSRSFASTVNDVLMITS